MNTRKIVAAWAWALSFICPAGLIPSARLRVFAFLSIPLSAVLVAGSAVGGSAQTEPRAQATITFSNGESIKIRSGRQQFRPIEVLPGERVQIRLELPPNLANTLVVLQPLDGGLVSGDVVIGADGTGAIAFQAGVQPGLYRLLLSARRRCAMLQFAVPAP